MPTPLVQEDLYECRVKRIFTRLRKEYRDEFKKYDDTTNSFEEWLDKNKESVAKLFMDDVHAYMGIPTEED